MVERGVVNAHPAPQGARGMDVTANIFDGNDGVKGKGALGGQGCLGGTRAHNIVKNARVVLS
jgi:hypothetical protein